eukprot:TRINITY_DN8380_c0_g1_i2.p1 TRINITY_DN8380_c0_g1~~TRINITY_DN8380_c0_g1_i2.p1  ORF type:complete len:151 (+),score=5.61 TRINITY_DN8380_c0_g1_i2:161-613(+)
MGIDAKTNKGNVKTHNNKACAQRNAFSPSISHVQLCARLISPKKEKSLDFERTVYGLAASKVGEKKQSRCTHKQKKMKTKFLLIHSLFFSFGCVRTQLSIATVDLSTNNNKKQHASQKHWHITTAYLNTPNIVAFARPANPSRRHFVSFL